MSMPVLVTGAGGMLGSALAAHLGTGPHRALTRAELDITDELAVSRVVADFAREADGGRRLVINAAAYTNVEGAESDRDGAYLVNELGAANVARAAREEGLALVHVSTDFVFDGRKGAPYRETDAVNPLSVYGESKYAGELAVRSVHPEAIIVRTSWVFGPGGSADFPTKILARARGSAEISVVDDEWGCPTYAPDLADGILRLAQADVSGLFHLAGSGSCSRFEMAKVIVDAARLETQVIPVKAAQFESAAARPADARLDCAKAAAIGIVLPHWEESLRTYVGMLGKRS